MRRVASKFINRICVGGDRRRRTMIKELWKATPHNQKVALKLRLIAAKEAAVASER